MYAVSGLYRDKSLGLPFFLFLNFSEKNGAMGDCRHGKRITGAMIIACFDRISIHLHTHTCMTALVAPWPSAPNLLVSVIFSSFTF